MFYRESEARGAWPGHGTQQLSSAAQLHSRPNCKPPIRRQAATVSLKCRPTAGSHAHGVQPSHSIGCRDAGAKPAPISKHLDFS